MRERISDDEMAAVGRCMDEGLSCVDTALRLGLGEARVRRAAGKMRRRFPYRGRMTASAKAALGRLDLDAKWGTYGGEDARPVGTSPYGGTTAAWVMEVGP